MFDSNSDKRHLVVLYNNTIFGRRSRINVNLDFISVLKLNFRDTISKYKKLPCFIHGIQCNKINK